MTHRGGIASDGKTGDGCGLLLQKPDRFFRDVVLAESGVELAEFYGVGAIMLGQDESAAHKAVKIFEESMAKEGIPVVAWRHVPTNNDCLGPIALASVPQFKQVFINQPEYLSEAEFAA